MTTDYVKRIQSRLNSYSLTEKVTRQMIRQKVIEFGYDPQNMTEDQVKEILAFYKPLPSSQLAKFSGRKEIMSTQPQMTEEVAGSLVNLSASQMSLTLSPTTLQALTQEVRSQNLVDFDKIKQLIKTFLKTKLEVERQNDNDELTEILNDVATAKQNRVNNFVSGLKEGLEQINQEESEAWDQLTMMIQKETEEIQKKRKIA